MAKSKPKTHNMMKSQIKALCRYIFDNCSSHGIAKAEMLPVMAKASGLTWTPPKAMTKNGGRGSLKSPNGYELTTITLHHRDHYAKMVADEGLGGSVQPGDWYAFTALYMVENLAKSIAGFSSMYEGRGRRYEDCLVALGKYAEDMPAEQDAQAHFDQKEAHENFGA